MAARKRRDPFAGCGYFIKGFTLLGKPGIRPYVAVPLAINVVLFTGAIVFGAGWFDTYLDGLLPEWLAWLEWLLLPLFVVVLLAFGFFTFTMVANLIASPFNGLLAEAVERHLTGRPPISNGWRQLLGELVGTLASEIRKLAYIVGWSIPILLLMVVPLVNIAGSLLWLAFGAWMMAITYMDYPMGNHGLRFAEQRRRLRENRLLGLGFGAAAMAALSVPVLNFLVVPAGVCGATAMWVEQFADGADGPA